MPGLLANRGLLATTWFVVLGALAGGLALVLVQPPPPPPLGAPAVAALSLPQPDLDQEAPGGAKTALPETPGGDQPMAAPPATVEPTAAAPAAQPETPPAAPDPAAAQPAPTRQPVATAALPPAAPPAPGPGLNTAPDPEPSAAEQTEPPAAPPAEPPVPAPAVSAELTLPEPKPEAPSEGAGAAADNPAEEQMAAIPVIPPAPEELPYWERYRQPFNMADKRPRIAVVLTGLGLSDSATQAAIDKLPPAVTLSFSPYARGLERWIALARARGHEVMIDLPMEPATFPNEDPGPQGLLVNLSIEDNLNRLDWVLSRGSAYVGLAGAMGSRFTASREAMKPILDDVKQRGLIFLDRRTTEHSVVPEIALQIGLPRAINNRSVDERQASRVAIDARLAQIERIALSEGFAVAMAQPYPVTLDRLAEWATELIGRGFVIAPISALADQQKTP